MTFCYHLYYCDYDNSDIGEAAADEDKSYGAGDDDFAYAVIVRQTQCALERLSSLGHHWMTKLKLHRNHRVAVSERAPPI